MKKIKEGDIIYDKAWEVFAKIRKFKGADKLFHTDTKFKMAVTQSKSWILISEENIKKLLKMVTKSVIVTDSESRGKDEAYYEMYVCSNESCNEASISREDKFCKSCGSKIIWKVTEQL